MKRHLFGTGGDESGAVAPTVALSLFALIAVGGIAFDYARLATMDTELQNAADQAALAAASQLDKKINACSRANAAAQTLVANQTRFANDNNASGIAVTIPSEPLCDATGSVRFYQNKEKTLAATSDANARFVEITVNSRTANYALTPIAGAFTSGGIAATAFAGMGSAICKIPPLMLCNPSPGTPFNADNLPTHPTAPGYKGVGLKLFMGGGGNAWGPGAFGWLDVGAVNNGTPDQNIAVGMNFPNTNCVADAGVNVDTGVTNSVLDALNVRFDIFHGGWATNTCYGHSACSPAYNTTKDLMRLHPPTSANCGLHDAQWRLPPDDDQYVASNPAGDDSNIKIMGYPMDICHFPAGGSCATSNARFGNGNWRRDYYFAKNHDSLTAGGSNWQSATGLPANASRYDVYRWEQNIAGVGNGSGSRPSPAPVPYDFNGPNNDGDYRQHGSPVCKPPGLAPSPTQPDRRVIAAAIGENCSSLSGGSTALTVSSWVEVFLVQPSVDRNAANTGAAEIYVEIIGRANPTGSGATAQVVHRDVPYLIE
jgi:Flp pilus assembly protein TadG